MKDKSQQHISEQQQQHKRQHTINKQFYRKCNLNSSDKRIAMLSTTQIANRHPEMDFKLSKKASHKRTHDNTNKNKFKIQRHCNSMLQHRKHSEIPEIAEAKLHKIFSRSTTQNSTANRWWLSAIFVLVCLSATCMGSSSSGDSYSPNSSNNSLALKNNSTNSSYKMLSADAATTRKNKQNSLSSQKSNRYSQPLTAIREVMADEDPEDTFRPFIPKDVSHELVARNVFTQTGQFRVFESPESDLRAAALRQKASFEKTKPTTTTSPETIKKSSNLNNNPSVQLTNVKPTAANNAMNKEMEKLQAKEHTKYDYVESPLRRQEIIEEDEVELIQNELARLEEQPEATKEEKIIKNIEIAAAESAEQTMDNLEIKAAKQTESIRNAAKDSTKNTQEKLNDFTNAIENAISEEEDSRSEQDTGKGEVQPMEQKSDDTATAADLTTELKSLEDLLLDYVENLFTKGKYEPIPGLVVELQNRYNDTANSELQQADSRQLQQQHQQHSRQRRHLRYTDAKVKVDVPRTLVSSGRLLFLTGE